MYHGWKVVICAFLVAMFGWGFGFYGVGAFLATLNDLHGWSTGEISSAITLYYMLGATLILFAGKAFQRFGPRWVVLVGIAAMSAGAVGLSLITAVWQLYLVFPVMALGWACMSGAALNLLIAPWFERKRGLAISLAFNGAGFGGVVIVPILLLLISRIGFTPAVLLVILVMAALLIPPVLAYLHRGPEVLGLGPDDDPVPAPLTNSVNSANSAHAAQDTGDRAPRPLTFLRTWHFWTISLPFSLGLMAQVGFIIHQVAFLTPTLGLQGAGWAVSLTTFAAILGRLIVGIFVDRVNRRAVAASNILMQAGAIGLMIYTAHPAVLYAACFVFGLGVGNMTSLPSLIVQVEYPKAAFAPIVSMVVALNQFTYSLGPLLLGSLRDWQGTYQASLVACAALLLMAAALVLSHRGGMVAQASRS